MTFRKVEGATRLTGSAYSISRIAMQAARAGKDSLTVNYGFECESLELDGKHIPVDGGWLTRVDDRFVYMSEERFSQIYPGRVYLAYKNEPVPGDGEVLDAAWQARAAELGSTLSYEEPGIAFAPPAPAKPRKPRGAFLDTKGSRTRPINVSVNPEAVSMCPPSLDGVGGAVRALGPYHGSVTVNLDAYRSGGPKPRLVCGTKEPLPVFADSAVALPGCCHITPGSTFRTVAGLEAMRASRKIGKRSPVGYNLLPWLRRRGLTLVKIGGFTYIARRGQSRPILWQRVTADSWVVVPKKDSAGTFIVSGDKCAERIFA